MNRTTLLNTLRGLRYLEYAADVKPIAHLHPASRDCFWRYAQETLDSAFELLAASH